jgi:hypothetical protein
LKSDFSFLSFIKKQDKKFIILLVGALALAILLLPTSNKKVEEAAPLDEAARLEELCSKIEGVGECRVMVTYREGEVYAVAVICRGADNPKVRESVTELITSIYGIGANRVSIQKMA